MDLLTDVLRQSGLKRRLLAARTIEKGTALRFPCEKSLGLHVVTRGSVYVHAAGEKQPLQLQAGDMALMARGCEHFLSTEAVLTRSTRIEPATLWTADEAARAESASAQASAKAGSSVIGGAYQFWNEPVHPFFREIPAWFILRAESLPRLGPLALTVGMLEEEVNRRELGGEIIVHGLLDALFTHVLRELVREQGGNASGWSHAVTDPQVRQVVALMHSNCAHAWTLDELATRAGLSRTGLAERFRAAMGDTPLSHLRTLRMQRAMQVLSDSERTLEQVAQEVGYTDAFSFSKVFKRTVGVAPREFRRQDAREKSVPWRFNSA
jgi:AraC-like DNA-binding protein